MRVRRLEGPDDIRGVTRVNGLAWQEGYADLLPQDVLNGQVIDPSAEQVREWYEQVREDSDRFLVAEADGAVRGYAYFR